MVTLDHQVGGGIERVLTADAKQHDALKNRTMDKSLENTLKTGMNTKIPTCDDEGVFTMMMKTHTGNTSILRWVGGWWETGCRGGVCHMV
jgi:hypothetical protein